MDGNAKPFFIPGLGLYINKVIECHYYQEYKAQGGQGKIPRKSGCQGDQGSRGRHEHTKAGYQIF